MAGGRAAATPGTQVCAFAISHAYCGSKFIGVRLWAAQARVEVWRKTGIAALRDLRLTAVPAEALAPSLAGQLRVMDLVCGKKKGRGKMRQKDGCWTGDAPCCVLGP